MLVDRRNAAAAASSHSEAAAAAPIGRSSAQTRKELLDLIAPKLAGRSDRAFLDAVRNFRGTPDQLYQDTKIKALTKTWVERNLN